MCYVTIHMRLLLVLNDKRIYTLFEEDSHHEIFFRKEYKSMTIITRKSHDIKTKKLKQLNITVTINVPLFMCA